MSQFQGFGGSVHPARLCTIIQYIVIYICFELEEKITPTTNGSMNACMELVGLSASNAVKKHCFKLCVYQCYFSLKLINKSSGVVGDRHSLK